MTDIAKELRDMHAMAANSCDPQFNRAILKAAAEIERLRAIVEDACEVLRHYDLPEHAFHYQRVLQGKVPLTLEQKGDQG